MTEEPPRISRRKFLKATGAAIAGSALATLVGCGTETPTPRPNTTVAPEAAEVPKEEVVFDQRGVRVWADTKTNLPTRWERLNGAKGEFDKEEVKRIKNEATKEKETRLVTVKRIDVLPHPWDQLKNQPNPNSEKKLDTELPNDVLSSEELKTQGIEIINGNNVELYIRKGAFEKGNVLEDFQENSGQEMQIVLVDEAIISPMALSDTQYKPIEHFIETHFGEETMYKNNNTVEEMRKILTAGLREGVKKHKGEERIYYERILKITDTFTDKELVDWGMYDSFHSGYTLAPRDKRSGGKHLVLVACGERKIRVSTLDIKVNAQGMFEYNILDYKAEELQGPDFIGLDQNQTRPKVSDLTQDKNGFYNGGPGYTLEHEIQHVKRNIEKPNDPVYQDNEKAVDAKAFDSIKHSEETGYYPFVLKRKNQKGYVLT